MSAAKVLQINGLYTVLVVPPLRDQVGLFSKKHFDVLYPLVTAFSLVTYDYSNIERPGANSPINWVRETVKTTLTFASTHATYRRVWNVFFYFILEG